MMARMLSKRPNNRSTRKVLINRKTVIGRSGTLSLSADSSETETTTKSSPVRDKGDATAKITLMLKRKNGKFGIGIRDDNYVHEVWKGGASHLAGIREGDWVSLALAPLLHASPLRPHCCTPVNVLLASGAQIVSVAGVSVADYAHTRPLLTVPPCPCLAQT